MECNGRTDDWYPQSQISPIDDKELFKYKSTIDMFNEKAQEFRTINKLHFGGFIMDVWYYVPLADELQNEDVYCCEFCLNYMNNERSYKRHMAKCPIRTPPGVEIYRDEKIIFYEVDGQQQKRYCRNISYLARMFL